MKSKVDQDGDFAVDEVNRLTVSKAESNASKAQSAHKIGLNTFFKANNRKYTSDFQPMGIIASDNTLYVTFGLTHKIPANNLLDVIDGVPEKHHFQKEKHLDAYLSFKVMREGEHLFLKLKCHAYPDIHNYDLSELLATLGNKSSFSVSDTTTYIPVNGLHYAVRNVITGARRSELIAILDDFNANCLGRFEELTVGRDGEAYSNCRDLRDIIDRITINYKAVSQEDYSIALARLTAIENSETFANDPPIILSYKSIRPALGTLCQNALIRESGILINAEQLNLFLQELKKHESMSNESKAWFPIGTIDQLETEIQSFLEVGIKLPNLG